jgi:hypothetical protein
MNQLNVAQLLFKEASSKFNKTSPVNSKEIALK